MAVKPTSGGPMPLDRFWSLVDEVRAASGARADDLDALGVALRARLTSLAADDVRGFLLTVLDLKDRSYRPDLWGAARVMLGGCTDEGFADFRGWLVVQGRGVWEAALRSPDDLADHSLSRGRRADFPGVTAIPAEVYQAKTGREVWDDLPTSPRRSRKFAVTDWSDADLPQLLPRLTAKFAR